MAKYKQRQARIFVDVKTRQVKVTDEDGNEPETIGTEQAKKLYEDGVVFVAAIYQSQSNPSRARKCIIVDVGGTTYKICM